MKFSLTASILLFLTLACPSLLAQGGASAPDGAAPQSATPDQPPQSPSQSKSSQQPPASQNPPAPTQQPQDVQEFPHPPGQEEGLRPAYGQQPKRILGFMPNIRAVSVGEHVPPPTVKEKFRLATENSFDYSGLISVGFETSLRFSQRSYRQFGVGMEGYGQYYWHDFVDRTIGQYLTNAIIPSLTAEDTRYYTMGIGPWYKRAAYAFTRTLITPNNDHKNTFNFSEVVGKGAVAGLGNLYYPGGATWTRTGQRWATLMIFDGSYAVFREFWPDIAVRLRRLRGQ